MCSETLNSRFQRVIQGFVTSSIDGQSVLNWSKMNKVKYQPDSSSESSLSSQRKAVICTPPESPVERTRDNLNPSQTNMVMVNAQDPVIDLKDLYDENVYLKKEVVFAKWMSTSKIRLDSWMNDNHTSSSIINCIKYLKEEYASELVTYCYMFESPYNISFSFW